MPESSRGSLRRDPEIVDGAIHVVSIDPRLYSYKDPPVQIQFEYKKCESPVKRGFPSCKATRKISQNHLSSLRLIINRVNGNNETKTPDRIPREKTRSCALTPAGPAGVTLDALAYKGTAACFKLTGVVLASYSTDRRL